MENLVAFKGTVDGLTIILDKTATFDRILEEFKYKLKKNKRFFKGAEVALRFKGREVTEEEQSMLLDCLSTQKILGISFIHSFKEDELIAAVKQGESSEKVMEERTYIEDLKTKTEYHYGIVRSGQQVSSNGTLIVLGDVNPGGMLMAGENVIVLGSLKGNVRAGLNLSGENNFVIALDMQPRQIGIKNVLTQSPDGSKPSLRVSQNPQIAYMVDQQIYVENISINSINNIKR